MPYEKFQPSTKTDDKCSLEEAVVSDLLKNTNLDGGSTTAIVEDKTTLARTCGGTLPVAHL